MKLLRGINVVSISVPDLEQGRAFYRDVLGLGEPIYDLPQLGWVEFSAGAEGGNIALVAAEAKWQPSFSTTVVLNVENCHAAVSELTSRGVSCDEPVTVAGFVTFANIRDPFGNRLQICSDAPES